jgi:glycosyltransferase involved in cell wall biosynthesis
VLTSSYEVDLVHHVPDLTPERLADAYDLELSGVRLRYVEPFPTIWPYVDPRGDRLTDKFRAHRALTQDYDLFVSTVMSPPIRSYARRGLLLVLFPSMARGDLWPWCEPAGRTPFVKKVLRNAYYNRLWQRVFAGYDRCVANSSFTAKWIARRWGIDAEVVYPPVRARFEERPKSKLILSVGRFSRWGTRKQQREMVEAFARACDTLPAGWEYWCMGGLSDDLEDRSYFDGVSDAARGYPVRVVANPPGEEIKDAYERAAVFWHAAGYGEDEEAHPERTEHFGMSTVEAMAAGCVPVVIRKGGQPEIVEHGSSGFLWNRPDELATYTRELAATPELRQRMADAARGRAREFTSVDAFKARMLRIIG